MSPDWWYSRSVVLTLDGDGRLRDAVSLEAPFRLLPEGIVAVPGAGLFFVGARSHGATAVENRMALVRLDERLELLGDIELEVLPWSRFHHGAAGEPGTLYAAGRSMRSVDGDFRDLRLVVSRIPVELDLASACVTDRVPSLTSAGEALVEVEPGLELLSIDAGVAEATATVRPFEVPVRRGCGP
jgi:hypothetical protein